MTQPKHWTQKKPITPRERLALQRFGLDVLRTLTTVDWSPDTLDAIADSARFHGLARDSVLFKPVRRMAGRVSI